MTPELGTGHDFPRFSIPSRRTKTTLVPVQPRATTTGRGRMVTGATIGLLLSLAASGCAIHYVDPATGTEHLWGIGHLKMRAAPPAEGLKAIVRGTEVLGISIGRADQQTYLTVGWHRVQRLDVVEENAAVRLEWPSSDFATVRVGSQFPLGRTLGARDVNPEQEREATP